MLSWMNVTSALGVDVEGFICTHCREVGAAGLLVCYVHCVFMSISWHYLFHLYTERYEHMVNCTIYM